MKYIRRLMEENFEMFCTVMRIVLVCGPRQCGKTTLLKQMLASDERLMSLDDPSTLLQASEEPTAFIRSNLSASGRITIDEIQKAPELFGVIKLYADNTNQPGQFLISGSSNYKALPTVNESLAGRLGQIRLRTFAAAEIAEIDKRNWINDIRNRNFGARSYRPEECSKEVVLEKALRGGYPSVFNRSSRFRKVWFDSYIKALFERDLADVVNLRKKELLPKILHRLASVSSRTVNMTQLGNDLEESGPYIQKFINALVTMYLVDVVPAWTFKSFDRLTKSPKYEITDTGLMCSVLNHYQLNDLLAWVSKNGKQGTDLIGNLIETWVYTQLAPLVEASGEWTIYHFRLSQRQEIDFILENPHGELILIEVKASETVRPNDFDNIRWFKTNIPNTVSISIVLYCGQDVMDYSDDCYAVPMASLWT